MGRQLESLPRFTRALMKSHLIACGFSYEDTDKPIIAIANSWNEFNHGHLPQRELAQKVKDGIRAGGGLPLEFNTIGPCDAHAQGYDGMNYILPSREIIADSIEAMIRSQNIVDGLVIIASCDKITPGMLMAALRLDLPCIHLCSGTCVPAISFAESKEIRRSFLLDTISEREMAEANARLYPHAGICPYIGTANTMDIFAEALGLALPGSAVIPAGTSERLLCAQATGIRIVEMASSQARPRQILRRESFDNALKVLAAVCGSLNQLLHVPAVAAEMGIRIDFEHIGRLNDETPQLCTINPTGPHSVADLHRAGGVPALMKELLPLLDGSCGNVSGKTVAEIAADSRVQDPTVIRSLGSPVAATGGLVILKGNIASEGAAVRLSTVAREMRKFSGPAIVFDSEDQASQALEHDRVRKGSVVIIRYEGPKGGPGMREMHRIVEALRKLGPEVAVVTDGRFSGASGGLSIGYLSPEAAQGGAIAAVEDGDIVEIDLVKRTLDVRLTDDELHRRLRRLKRRENPQRSKLLVEYAARVGTTSSGAVKELPRPLAAPEGSK